MNEKILTQAIYEKGILRLLDPVDIQEGCKVEVLITHHSDEPKKSPNEILDSIASLPLENPALGSTCAGEDHDEVLYKGTNWE